MAQPYNMNWSAPRIVMTHFGERKVVSATPTEAFWEAWRADKAALKADGYSVSKGDKGWQATRWLPTMSDEQRTANVEASRAAVIVDASIPVPAGNHLRPFQTAGITYALGREATLIADEMGLGKTIQAIGVANVTRPRTVLVICPASLKLNWRNEINVWQTLGLPVHVVNAGDECIEVQDCPGWYIINFDICHRFAEVLKSIEWDLIVLDECHRLKTRSAQRTLAIFGGEKTVKELDAQGVERRRKVSFPPIRAKRRLLLTGTPIVNRPAELFPLLQYIDPVRWNSFFSFAKRYCAAFHNGYGWDFTDASNLPELQDRLRATCMVRRLKKDVLTELPAKVRQLVMIEPQEASVRALIKRANELHERGEAQMARARDAMMRAEAEGDDAAYAEAVAKLHSAGEVVFEEVARLRHDIGVAKIPYAREHLEGINGDRKVVVFAHHRDVIEGLTEELEPGTFVVVTGDTPIEARQAAVEAFQNDPRVMRFFGNLQAAGVGITLTASSHVLCVEQDWVPGNMSQAEDRCHRIGQHDSVLVQHLVLEGSHDVRLVKALIAKQEVIDAAVDKNTDFDYDVYVPRPAPPVAVRPALPPIPALRAEQVAAVHKVLRLLAGMNADHAVELNDMGYNSADSMFGHDLGARETLTNRQAHVAMKMVRKYRRQYSTELFNAMYGEG